METLRTSNVLKFISYILFPIFVLCIGLSIFHLAFLDEYGNTESTRFIDTEMFSSNYIYYITDNMENAYHQKNDGTRMFMQLEDANGNEIYYLDRDYMYSYYNGINEYIDFIIIDNNTDTIYTNMKSSDYSYEIENMKNSPKYWIYNNGNIETNMDYINSNNIRYNSTYQYFVIDNVNSKESETYAIDKEITGYTIYSRYNLDKTEGLTNYKIVEGIYEFCLNNKNLPIYILPISVIFTFAIAIYLCWAIGYEKKKDEIKLGYIDKIPYEILALACGILITIFTAGAVECLNIANYITIELQCEYIKPTKVKNGASRSPMQAPTIGFDGRRLYLYGQFSGLTLELLDNGVIVYSAPVEAYANEVVLPDMPGTYELQLCDDMYIYSCELEAK